MHYVFIVLHFTPRILQPPPHHTHSPTRSSTAPLYGVVVRYTGGAGVLPLAVVGTKHEAGVHDDIRSWTTGGVRGTFAWQ